jgi:TRAP-type C4-dicarboxylate transport system permease large subunit
VSRRSVTNDRYRVENKGKTRKSASSAKPKREAGSTSSAVPAKAAAKTAKKRPWGRGGARRTAPAVPSTPEMKKLRRYWWALMAVAVVVALAMWPTSGLKNRTLNSALFATYAVVLAAALYLEFGPLRKARAAAIASAKKEGKSGGKRGVKPTGGKGGAEA